MAYRAFPQEPEAFADDDRVSFSRESKSYILEDDEGNEWEWLEGPQKWSKTVRFLPSCPSLSNSPMDRLWPAYISRCKFAMRFLSCPRPQTSNFIPWKQMDEEAVKRQAEIYKVAGVDEDEPALIPAKKRKESALEEVSS